MQNINNPHSFGGLRPMAARGSDSAAPERMDPQKLLGIMPVKTYLVGYSDSQGIPRKSMCFDFGDGVLYSTKDSETWTDSLRPLSTWLQKQLDATRAAQTAAADEDLQRADEVELMHAEDPSPFDQESTGDSNESFGGPGPDPSVG